MILSGGFFYVWVLITTWLPAFLVGMLAEIVQMIIILLVARPFNEAVELVKILWFPMICFNPVGISPFC